MLAVYAATRNLYSYVPMAIGSLLEHNPTWKVIFYCEDDELDFIKDPRIEVRNVSTIPEFLEKNNPNLHTPYSFFCVIRCYLPKLL